MMLVVLLVLLLYVVVVISDLPKKTHYEMLGIDTEADFAEIKKAFRALALELHPDKVSVNATETEREEAHDLFLDIQDAYFVLSDPERRRKYDLEREDITYDIYDDDVGDRYTSGPFKLFAKTRRFRMVFEASFEPNIIPTIMVPLDLELHEVYNGIKVTRNYFRRGVCGTCGGTGGKDGECTMCEHCHGEGTAVHYMSREPESNVNEDGERVGNARYRQFTETKCGVCGGLGCRPVGKCGVCGGRGFVMQNDSVTMHIPPGARQGFQVVAQGFGHQRMKPAMRGDVMAILRYRLHEGWTCDAVGNLKYSQEIPLRLFAEGTTFNVPLPSSETVMVTVHPVESLVDILTGKTSDYPGYGMPDPDTGTRADLTVEVKPNLEKGAFDEKDVVAALAVMGVHMDDPSFPPMMAIFGFKVAGYDDFSRSLDESMFTIDPKEVEIIDLSE